ncbi:MAG: YfcE family phosphodiesterase [Deltaproteobacteria bacterium]|nr:MAG: YfcE family phosphodiesterase [Deltaproteobacteria bacterium]
MKLAVMSDSHDHISHLRAAVDMLIAAGAGAIIHCGDLVAPFMLAELARADVPVHAVFGNNDGDIHKLTTVALTQFPQITFHGLVGETALGGQSVAFTHYETVARGLALSGRFSWVFFGHTHTYHEERVGEAILLNPGDVMGKKTAPGFVIIDLKSGDIAHQRLQPSAA